MSWVEYMNKSLGFLLYLFATLEGWSFNFSIIYIIFSIKKSSYAWLFAIISSILYGIVCIDSNLYATAFLQLFFIISSIYGFIQWRKAEENKIKNQEKDKTWSYTVLNKGAWVLISSATLLAFASIYTIFSIFTRHTSISYIESFAIAGSLMGQYLQAKRCIYNWHFWFIVNISYVIVNINQGLYLMTILYAIFVMLSMQGYFSWKRNEQMA